MIANPNRRTAATLAATACFAAAVLTLSLQRTGGDVAVSLVEEDGPVQMLSAFGYVACAAVIAARFGIPTALRHWYMPLLLITMTLRELDFHKRFSSQGIFKSNFYLSGEVPITEKLIALAVTGLVAAAAVTLARRHLATLFQNLRRMQPAAVAVVCAAACAVASKLVDGLARKLTQVGLEISTQTAQNAVVLEELLELGIPVILIVAVCLSRTDRGPSSVATTLQPSQPADASGTTTKAA